MTRHTKSHDALPFPVVLALRKVGSDISRARKLRGMTQASMAERAMISRNTLARVEQGDAGVALGTYASVLFILGLADRLGNLLKDDVIAEERMAELLPKRVRTQNAAR